MKTLLDRVQLFEVGRDRRARRDFSTIHFYRRSQRKRSDWGWLAQNFQAGFVFAFDNRNTNGSSLPWLSSVKQSGLASAASFPLHEHEKGGSRILAKVFLCVSYS
jgi:hypothetical protein